MSYPKILYHATLAREGQRFLTALDEPAADAGWVDTPEKFNPDYVAPTPVEGQSATRPGYVPKKYPTILYRRDGEAKRVLSIEDARALAAREPGEWADHPDGPWGPAPDAPAPTVAPPVAPVATPAAPPPAPPPTGDPLAEAASQYAATVAEIADHLPSIKDKAVLEKILAYEEDNPKGPRIGVVKAVAKRLDELPPAPVT